jgi:ribosome-dependent ATPase
VNPSAARVRGASLRYGKVAALEDVTLDVPGGCMAGFIGPDGVGKSSLLALIAGARALQSGTIEVLGGDMGDARHRAAVCPRVAYMPQGLGRNLYPTLSVFENADFFASLFGQGRAERARRINGLLKATGLKPFAARPVGQLSGGMKQKLGLVCALIHDPDLLILDEPTTGLDPVGRAQVHELIATLAREHGVSMLLCSHHLSEVERLCQRAIVMDHGRLILEQSLREPHGIQAVSKVFQVIAEQMTGRREVP